MPKWRIDFDPKGVKALKALSRQDRDGVISYMENKVANYDDPFATGKALVGGPLKGLWRYRMGDVRIICSIDRKTGTITVKDAGRRDGIYATQEGTQDPDWDFYEDGESLEHVLL